MKNFLQILRYILGYKGYAALNVLFGFLYAVFNLLTLLLFIPFLNLLFDVGVPEKKAVDPGWNREYAEVWFYETMSSYVDTDDKLSTLGFICVVILVLFLLKNIFFFLGKVMVSYLRQGIAKDLRSDVHDKILSLPLAYFSDERKGDIMARSTADVLEIEQSIIGAMEMLTRDPINVVLSLIAMVLISPQLTLFSLILLPISAFVINRISKSLKRTSLKGQDKQGELLSYLEESLGGLRIIKAFNAEGQVNKSFDRINDGLRKVLVRLNVKRESAPPVSEFLGVCVMVGLVWYGGRLILSDVQDPTAGSVHRLDGAEFMGFIIMFFNLLRPVQNIAKAVTWVARGSASVDRVNVILKAENTIVDKPNARSLDGFNAAIRYKNVGFAYETDQVLSDIDLLLEKGRSLALVGESGGGKSTIADLLPRFYDVGHGSIEIDEVDIRDVRLRDLRSLMGIVTQQSILFNDSVFGNIAFGMENASRSEVEAAAKVANAHDFIMQLQSGYDTNIGDGGNKLSGGQKQRISIARAVLKNPPILILDEATSALDTESEKLVQDALLKLMKDRTSLIIAHRLSTIQHVDEIIVLQKGRIVERGTHTELIAKSGVYKRLCDLQGFS